MDEELQTIDGTSEGGAGRSDSQRSLSVPRSWKDVGLCVALETAARGQAVIRQSERPFGGLVRRFYTRAVSTVAPGPINGQLTSLRSELWQHKGLVLGRWRRLITMRSVLLVGVMVPFTSSQYVATISITYRPLTVFLFSLLRSAAIAGHSGSAGISG